MLSYSYALMLSCSPSRMLLLNIVSEDEEDEEQKDSWFFCSTKAAKELLGEKCRHKNCVLPCEVTLSSKGDKKDPFAKQYLLLQYKCKMHMFA